MIKKVLIVPSEKPLRSRKLRDSAKLQECTLQIVGVCNREVEKVSLCHVQDDSGTGHKATKSPDWCAVFGCSSCHAVLDGHARHKFLPGEKEFYIRRALIRTWRRWIDMGLVTIEGGKHG